MELETELKGFRELESKGDQWGILRVSRDATQDEIKSGYEKLFRKYAPREEEAAVEILIVVNEAFKILKDPKTVDAYCKKAYIQKGVDECFEVDGREYYTKKETIVNALINDAEISGNDCAFLKGKGKSYLIDKISEVLKPLDVYITKDECRQGCTEALVEQHSGRKIDVRIPAYTENGKIIPINDGKHFVRVKVIPADADEIFKRIVKKVKIDFPFVDLNTFISTQEIKEFIRGNAKEQYRKYNRVNEQEIIEKVIQPLSGLPKPQPFDVYITKDEYREGCTETLVEQHSGRKIDVRIPAHTENGKIIPINGGKHFVKVRVIPADGDEIFEKIVETVKIRFPSANLSAFNYKFNSEIKGLIRNEVKEHYRKYGYVNEQQIIEKVIQPLSSAVSNIGQQEYASTRYTPSKTTTGFKVVCELIKWIIGNPVTQIILFILLICILGNCLKI